MLLASRSAGAQTWQTTGPDETNHPSLYKAGDGNMAFSASGVLYFAFIDRTTDAFAVSVRRLKNGTWEGVGAPDTTAVLSLSPSLTFDGDVPYIAVGINSGIVVKRFEGGQWNMVGSATLAPNTVTHIKNSVHEHIPYVLYRTFDDEQVYFKKFAANTWTTVSTGSFLHGIHTFDLALDGATPYVAYPDKTTGNITVRKFNGTDWVLVGSTDDSFKSAAVSIAINNGTPYITYHGVNNKATVRKFNGTQWEYVGAPEFTDTEAWTMSLKFDGNIPYMVYKINSQYGVNVVKFDGSNWVKLGTAFSSSDWSYGSLADVAVLNGKVYAATLDAKVQKARIKEFDGVNWQFTGNTGITQVVTSILDVKTDRNNVPYMLYINSDDTKAFVRRFDGVNWQPVGSTPVAADRVLTGKLGFTSDGQPLVLCNNYNAGTSAVLFKTFNGNSWVDAPGAAHLPTDQFYPQDFGFDDDIPYVLYSNGAEQKLTLKKYNNNEWLTVGNADFAPQYYSKLLFHNHLPYVILKDEDNMTFMMNFDGSQWKYLGSAVSTTNIGITHYNAVITDNGTVYAAYLNSSKRKVSVRKFNGTSWEAVGADFDGSYTGGELKLFQYNNAIYLFYSDATQKGKISVVKYTGRNWVSIGQPGFTVAGATTFPFITNDKLQFVYSLGEVYQKVYNGVFDYAQPTVQVSNLKTSAVSANQATLSWKKGNGTGTVIFVKSGSYVNNTPADGVTYTANKVFRSGTQIGTSGWYCIYNGTDTTVTVTGLTVGNSYEVAAYTYNGQQQPELYLNTLTAGGNRATFTTFLTDVQLAGGQWTWAGGANTYYPQPVYGSQGYPSNNNTPGTRVYAGEWTDNEGNFWLYGGTGYGGITGDMWKFDTQTKQWAWMWSTYNTNPVYGTQGVAAYANTPGARNYPITWKGSDGNLWLMGGEVFNTSTGGYYTLSDVWKFDIATRSWTWVAGSQTRNPAAVFGTKGVPAAGNLPSGRVLAASWTDAEGGLWLMGGQPSSGSLAYQNDLWRFDIVTKQWTWMGGSQGQMAVSVYGNKNVAAATNMPGARRGAACWQDGNLVYIMGGAGSAQSGLGHMNDLWRFDLTTQLWTWLGGEQSPNQVGSFGTKNIPLASNQPPGRYLSHSWVDKNKNLWLMGGWGLTTGRLYGYFNDLWMYNTKTQMWVWVNGSESINPVGVYNSLRVAAESNVPGARVYGVDWVDKDGNLWTYGGLGYIVQGQFSRTGDMWVYKPEFVGPVANATNVTVSNITFTQATIKWKKGGGDKRAVFIKKGTYGSVNPVNKTSHIANTEFGKSQVNSTDWFCVYNGADSAVTVTGLTANTRYQVFVAEYTGAAGEEAYNVETPSGNPVNFSTSLALTGLTASEGTLSPQFAASTLNYSIKLPSGQTGISFTPVTDTVATIRVRGNVVASGSQSGTITLNEGNNIIPVVVSIGDESTTYNISVKVGSYTSQINFAALPQKTYGDANFDAGAVSDNNETPIVYTSSDTQVARVVDGKISIIKNGTAVITASQPAANGYEVAVPVTQVLTVNKAPLTITARNKSRLYGAASNGTIFFTYTGFVNGDTQAKLTGGLPVATANADSRSPVGDYVITTTVNPSDYYDITTENGTLTITKAILTVTPNPANRRYGAADPVITFGYSGFVNGENVSKLSIKPVANIEATQQSLPGKYTMTGTGALATNYDFNYLPGVFTIERAIVTITPKNKTITYGMALPALTFNYAGLVNGETVDRALTTTPEAVTTATSASPSGNYPITASGATSGKYIIKYAQGTLTINRAQLTAIARNQTREQYQSNPTLTVRYTGFVNGDTEAMLSRAPQAVTNANENSAPGRYPIKVSNGYSPYYNFTYTAGTLTVNPPSVLATAKISSTADELAVAKTAAVTESDIVVHAALSPNGDGQNDYWQIDNIEKYTNNHVTIVTRAGAVVYEVSGYDNYSKRFEGYSSLAKIRQQPGTYLYVINYEINGEQKKKTGYLVVK